MTARSAEPRARVLAAFVALYLVWGSTYLAIRYAVETIPPFLMGGARFAISGAILFVFTRQRGGVAPTRAQWKAAAITGVLLLVGGNGAVIWSEQHVASGIVALIVAIVPVWMVLLDWLRPGGVRPRTPVFAGLALGLVGLALLIGPDALRSGAGAGVSARAALVPVVGSMLWAVGSIYSRQAAKPPSAPMATGMQMLAGGAAFLLLAALTGELGSFRPDAVGGSAWLGFAYLVTFGSLIGFTAYIYLLRATTAAKASTYAYVNPVVAVFLGWAVANEPVTARTIVAATVILAGVAIISLTGSTPARARDTVAAPAKDAPADEALRAAPARPSGERARAAGDPAVADGALRRRRTGDLLEAPEVGAPHEPQSRTG